MVMRSLWNSLNLDDGRGMPDDQDGDEGDDSEVDEDDDAEKRPPCLIDSSSSDQAKEEE